VGGGSKRIEKLCIPGLFAKRPGDAYNAEDLGHLVDEYRDKQEVRIGLFRGGGGGIFMYS
jgi:hypothetical protein